MGRDARAQERRSAAPAACACSSSARTSARGTTCPPACCATRILARRPDAEVDDPRRARRRRARGPGARAPRAPSSSSGRLRRLFDLQYWLVARFPPTRALATRLAARLGRPLAAGRRRPASRTWSSRPIPAAPRRSPPPARAAASAVPVVSAITDLAALRYWAHRGCDLHLVIHPESAAEIRAIAGADARDRARARAHVAGLRAPRRRRGGTRGARPAGPAPGRGGVRRRLGGRGPARRASRPRSTPARACACVALCGRNEGVRRRLERGLRRRGPRCT